MNEKTDKKNFVDVQRFRKEVDEYRKFAFGKNLLLIAVALVMGNSLQKLVTVFSETLLMPVVNYFVTQTSGNWRNIILVPVEGINLEVGKLAGGVIEFLITSSILYIVYSRVVRKVSPEAVIENAKIRN